MNTHSKQLSMTRRAAIGALIVLGLGAPALAAAKPSPIQVRDAWVRWLPAGLPAGGYMVIENNADHPIELLGARCDAYAHVMLHRTVRKGDTMDMVGVKHVSIPAHGKVEFRPGDYHIMLMQPKQDVKPGDKLPITLEFTGGAALRVEFEVRKSDATGAGSMEGMHMDGMAPAHGSDHP